jgi:hypothetical protein
MSEELIALGHNEGDPAFPMDNGAPETPSSGSQPENKGTDNTQATGGDGNTNIQPKKEDVPFNEHPRWKERETEWTTRFNAQETRHLEAVENLRKEFGTKKPQGNEVSNPDGIPPMPEWFGSDEDAWAKYYQHEMAREERLLAQAEERALKRFESDKTAKTEAQSKAEKESTDYMNAEVGKLEADKDLNPTGEKIDINKLIKIVIEDYQLVDGNGRWNWRAGLAIYNSGKTTKSPADRKAIAAATTSAPGAGEKSSTIKSAADFKKKKPW